MYCKNCGKTVDDKASVCVNCGYAIKTKTEKVGKIRIGIYLFIILFFYTVIAFKESLEDLIRAIISNM